MTLIGIYAILVRYFGLLWTRQRRPLSRPPLDAASGEHLG
jgi:hypothetical protein